MKDRLSLNYCIKKREKIIDKSARWLVLMVELLCYFICQIELFLPTYFIIAKRQKSSLSFYKAITKAELIDKPFKELKKCSAIINDGYSFLTYTHHTCRIFLKNKWYFSINFYMKLFGCWTKLWLKWKWKDKFFNFKLMKWFKTLNKNRCTKLGSFRFLVASLRFNFCLVLQMLRSV